MKKIYKYKIKTTDSQIISMPVEAKILTVQIQNGEPHIWALVDLWWEDQGSITPMWERTIEVFGTGNPIEDPNAERKYIGTYQLSNGELVFHVFEKIEK